MERKAGDANMKRYGFLFGAGAELAYNLPSGGQFEYVAQD